MCSYQSWQTFPLTDLHSAVHLCRGNNFHSHLGTKICPYELIFHAHIAENDISSCLEPVSKQNRLLVLSQKQCFKFRNLFFLFDKVTFIYQINLEELEKTKLGSVFCVFLKILLWK